MSQAVVGLNAKGLILRHTKTSSTRLPHLSLKSHIEGELFPLTPDK